MYRIARYKIYKRLSEIKWNGRPISTTSQPRTSTPNTYNFRESARFFGMLKKRAESVSKPFSGDMTCLRGPSWRPASWKSARPFLYRVQCLFPIDCATRMQFCRLFQQQQRRNAIDSLILFTFEDYLPGITWRNFYNILNWTHNDLHCIHTCKHQHHFWLSIWDNIIGDNLINPCVQLEHLNCHVYQQFLRSQLMAQFVATYDALMLNLQPTFRNQFVSISNLHITMCTQLQTLVGHLFRILILFGNVSSINATTLVRNTMFSRNCIIPSSNW